MLPSTSERIKSIKKQTNRKSLNLSTFSSKSSEFSHTIKDPAFPIATKKLKFLPHLYSTSNFASKASKNSTNTPTKLLLSGILNSSTTPTMIDSSPPSISNPMIVKQNSFKQLKVPLMNEESWQDQPQFSTEL